MSMSVSTRPARLRPVFGNGPLDQLAEIDPVEANFGRQADPVAAIVPLDSQCSIGPGVPALCYALYALAVGICPTPRFLRLRPDRRQCPSATGRIR